MGSMTPDTLIATLTDGEIVARVCSGETSLFEVLMRRHNQRVYRAARSIVDEAEAEDVMQQAYINAFVHLEQFESRAQFSTWLTRITIYEALARRRKQRPEEPLSTNDDQIDDAMAEPLRTSEVSPERQAYSSEIGRLIEEAVDALPDTYRDVFMLREVEGLSTSETAEGLGVGEEAVKTRLHRARAMVRRTLTGRLGGSAALAFQFHATRCDRVVGAVLREIRQRKLAPR
jgi:RNA polymerase sigma-70 factor, ECF subfamily